MITYYVFVQYKFILEFIFLKIFKNLVHPLGTERVYCSVVVGGLEWLQVYLIDICVKN